MHHGDMLEFRAKRFLLIEQPLESYFGLIGQHPALLDGSCPVGRGYAANWAIDDGWLYLVGLAGRWSDSSPVTLHHLFPFAGDRIFATWFSGTVHGFRLDEAVQPGSAADRGRYPDIVLTIDEGRVRSSSIVHRGAPGAEVDGGTDSPAERESMASAPEGSSLLI